METNVIKFSFSFEISPVKNDKRDKSQPAAISVQVAKAIDLPNTQKRGTTSSKAHGPTGLKADHSVPTPGGELSPLPYSTPGS